ncbi:hypothetical protein TNIN_103881 [Trichonephila inaurata madagascariensis]|uniref:Uncharacterized protein n=1 Tax=Trichonephila inaurata madagascariensis TaxID=2747483 RepID=A0A8X6YAP3_9ARAC|nr:hypothetical protein TNIN_103881 [Trichonephila inaurata madagascariensis]
MGIIEPLSSRLMSFCKRDDLHFVSIAFTKNVISSNCSNTCFRTLFCSPLLLMDVFGVERGKKGMKLANRTKLLITVRFKRAMTSIMTVYSAQMLWLQSRDHRHDNTPNANNF